MSASLNWIAWKALIGLAEWSTRRGGRALGLHVGELELDRLEGVDRLAELLALARVGDRVVGRPLSDAQCLGGDAEPGAIQGRHRDLEAVVDLADHVGGRDPHAVEDRLPGRRAADPELVLELADAEPRAVGLDHERGDPAGVARS